MHTMLKNTESLKHSKITLILECFNDSVFFNIVCISWQWKSFQYDNNESFMYNTTEFWHYNIYIHYL